MSTFPPGILVFHRCRCYVLVMLSIILDFYFWSSIHVVGHPSMWNLLRSITRANHLSGVVVLPHDHRKSHFFVTAFFIVIQVGWWFSWSVVIACWVGTSIVDDGCWGLCRMHQWPLHSREFVDSEGFSVLTRGDSLFSSDAVVGFPINTRKPVSRHSQNWKRNLHGRLLHLFEVL